jgi:uncharacterized protein
MRWFRRFRPTWKSWILGGLTLLSLVYMAAIEPNWIDVRPIALTLSQLDPAFEGYKIVQLTDIHADRWMNADRLARIVQIVNRQQPDLVALTGDYVTRAAPKYAPTLQVLGQLTPRDRSIAVLGNHDNYTDPEMIADVMRDSNIVLLRNQIELIQRGTAQLTIAGLSDVLAGDPDLPGVLAQMPAVGAAIMLVHEPDFADQTAATDRFDLQLSGHSHGGQIKLPLLGVRRLTPQLAKHYPSGLYQVQHLLQYTSRGVGLAGSIRVRLNCRPEITVLTLHAAKSSSEG